MVMNYGEDDNEEKRADDWIMMMMLFKNIEVRLHEKKTMKF